MAHRNGGGRSRGRPGGPTLDTWDGTVTPHPSWGAEPAVWTEAWRTAPELPLAACDHPHAEHRDEVLLYLRSAWWRLPVPACAIAAAESRAAALRHLFRLHGIGLEEAGDPSVAALRGFLHTLYGAERWYRALQDEGGRLAFAVPVAYAGHQVHLYAPEDVIHFLPWSARAAAWLTRYQQHLLVSVSPASIALHRPSARPDLAITRA